MKRCRVKYFKKKSKEIAKKYLLVGFVLVILVIAGFVLDRFFPINPTQSAAADNVSGWAWAGGDDGVNAGNGWISFNNTSGGGGINYGVNVDAVTGDFSGYAWAGGGVDAAGNLVPTLGWISFNRTVTGNPPAAPYNSGSGPIANLDFATKRVRGWAKVIAADGNGWDGWIKLGDDSGTWPAGGSQVYVQILAGPDEFRGWAWGSDVVGWIKFNCADAPANCGTSNYKVLININFPPSVTCNDAEIWNYCSDSKAPTLSWNYSDPDSDPQESYWIQIDNNSGFSSPEIDTGERYSSGNTYHPSPTEASNLNWNTKYYWRVKVKDNQGNWSGWSPAACSFTTPIHAYPDVDFTRSPYRPSAGENVRFTDDSTCYDPDAVARPCSHPDSGGNDSFSWTWTGPGTVNYDDPLTPTFENPVVSFSDPGNWTVKLEVTDSDGFMCSKTKSVKVSLPLPEWKEIIPR